MTKQPADTARVVRGKLICRDRRQRVHSLEQDLIAIAAGLKIEIAVTGIRKEGLVALLRAHTGRR